jgi:antitoxin HigA-1
MIRSFKCKETEKVFKRLFSKKFPQNIQLIIRRCNIMDKRKIPPLHPGEVLEKEFLGPMGITQNRLALAIGVPPRRINEIVHGKRRITADTALRLGRHFGMSPQFWLGLQLDYDLDIEEDKLGDRLIHEVREYAASG